MAKKNSKKLKDTNKVTKANYDRNNVTGLYFGLAKKDKKKEPTVIEIEEMTNMERELLRMEKQKEEEERVRNRQETYIKIENIENSWIELIIYIVGHLYRVYGNKTIEELIKSGVLNAGLHLNTQLVDYVDKSKEIYSVPLTPLYIEIERESKQLLWQNIQKLLKLLEKTEGRECLLEFQSREQSTTYLSDNWE